ncbi:MAG: hypothetical protein Q7S65_02890 [Nanoarchaeota archaeon]|nr:hypothetical protein [Nanoarchaeota archaeon]
MAMPVFVKIHQPADLQNTVDALRMRIEEARDTMAHLDSLSLDEAAKMHEWDQKAEAIAERIESMLTILHMPERV